MKKWKRFAVLLLTISMLLCLCACGEQNGGTDSKNTDSQSTEQDISKPAKQADTSVPSGTEEPSTSADTSADPAIQTLALQKQRYGRYEWDDDMLLVQSKFSHVTVWQNDTAKTPELAEVLAQTANMVKRSMEDEFDNLCATAQEELPWSGETSVSTLDIQVRRADSVVLSLLSDSYSDYGWIEDFRGMHGTNYDTQSGQELALNNVVEVNNDLANAVANELNSHQWAGDFDYRDAVQAYFANTPCDGISWTLDYNGVTFYFADGDLEEPGNGGKTATVSFAEYPELFEEKYMAVPAAYMVELPLDSSYFTDLDGDGDLEELNVTGYFDSDVGMYTKFGIYADANGSYHYEDYFADGFIPYYVKTADGCHYLYLFCEQYEGGPVPMFVLRVFDVSDGTVTGVGEMNAGLGYVPTDTYRVPTDPEDFYLEDYDAMAQDMMAFAVGPTGLPELKP